MLEDDFNDVLGKAIRGQAFNPSSLDIEPAKLRACLNGEFNQEIIEAISPYLQLDTQKLLNLPDYNPAVNLPYNVNTFVSSFGHLGVNGFTVENNTHILIFDTGTNSKECLNYISQHPDKEKHLFITHPHPDHLGCQQDFTAHVETSQQLAPNQTLTFGDITLRSLDVAGHAPIATAYLINGLSAPICIVGDALFAGSIGGVSAPLYQQALNHIRNHILSLPEDTLILNGHGPATSVLLEKENNPFF